MSARDLAINKLLLHSNACYYGDDEICSELQQDINLLRKRSMSKSTAAI